MAPTSRLVALHSSTGRPTTETIEIEAGDDHHTVTRELRPGGKLIPEPRTPADPPAGSAAQG